MESSPLDIAHHRIANDYWYSHRRGTVGHLLSLGLYAPLEVSPSLLWRVIPTARPSHGIDRRGYAQRGLDACLENNDVFAEVAAGVTSLAFSSERV